MKLSSVQKHFHKTPFTDAYQPSRYFLGKLMAFDDATRDSLSTERRMLSVEPGTVIPSRLTIKSGNHAWLVGDIAVDYHEDEELRNKYILHQATELSKVYTFENALAGIVSKELWANRLWVKGTKETDESSGVFDNYVIYFAKNEDIRHPDHADGTFFEGREHHVLVYIENRWHLVRTSYITAGGFLAAVVDELPEPVITDVTYTSRTHNPVPDTYTESSVVRKAIHLRWQSNFVYLTRYAEKYLTGDVLIKMLTSEVAGKADDMVQIGTRKYKIVESHVEGAIINLHLRHV